MGESSPYLFDAEPSAVAVRGEVDAEITVVSVRGSWDNPLWRQVSLTLRKCLTEHPGGLIVDLAELDDLSGRSVPTWLHARALGASMDPPVAVALCVPAEKALARRLRRVDAGRFLPVFTQVGQARAALTGWQPLTRRVELRLPADPRSPARARQMIRGVCAAWQLHELDFAAQLVMSELVSNAVEHTGTAPRVLVTRRGPSLHLAVADGSPHMPRLNPPPPGRSRPDLGEGGRGLQIVHRMARAWGAMPIEGGKVVWAVIRAPLPC